MGLMFGAQESQGSGVSGLMELRRLTEVFQELYIYETCSRARCIYGNMVTRWYPSGILPVSFWYPSSIPLVSLMGLRCKGVI